MKTYQYKQVDVFTSVPFKGNPLAVILDADGLSDSTMRSIAAWTNLSETVFVQKSARADYLLRIFGPRGELPFAGHPTIGSAHALREAGIIPPEKHECIQECQAGLIPIRFNEDNTAVARVPKAKVLTDRPDSDELNRAMNYGFQEYALLIDVGPLWMVARIDTYENLYALDVDAGRLSTLSRRHGSTGISVYVVDDDKGIHVRSFAPAHGILEDPVCGSGNAAVACHIRETGLSRTIGLSYTAHQGKALDRDGRVNIRLENDNILIGGESVTIIDGKIKF